MKKYWLFNGEDITGPWTAQELAAQPGFSAASMICPEEQSENELAWQRAETVGDFVAAVAAEKPAPQPIQPSLAPKPEVQHKPVVQKVVRWKPKASLSPIRPRPFVQEMIRLAKVEREPEEAAAVSLAAGQDIALDLPYASTQAQPGSEPQELVSAPQKQQASTILPVVQQSQPKQTEPAEHRPVYEEPHVSFMRTSLSLAPEATSFLTDTAQRRLSDPARARASAMLWVLSALLIPGFVWLSVRPNTSSRFTVPTVAAVSAPARPAEPAAAVVQTPDVRTAVPTVSVALTAQDTALAAVKNYKLPGNKGTIAAYFDTLYKDKLSQGYAATWDAEPLHRNLYIVKYRLTKTRTEPVVYVFQADGAQGKLVGALNNAALDLLGKK